MTTEVLINKAPLNEARKLHRYQPKHCQTILKMAANGYSLQSFCAFVEETHNTILLWMREFEEFREACKIAEMKRHLFYEKTAIENLQNKNFNSALFNKLTTAVIKWKDTPQLIEVPPEPESQEYKPPHLMSGHERMERIKLLSSQLQLDAKQD